MKYLTTLILLVAVLPVFGQSLSAKLRGKSNFEEIRTIAERHYSDVRKGVQAPDPRDLSYKHWKRWEWAAQNRLDADGNLFDHNSALIKADVAMRRSETATDQRSTNSLWIFTGPLGHLENPTTEHYIGLGRVDRIAFHPTNQDIIYLGTPAGGIWKTTNDGASWTPMDDFLPSLGVSGVVVDKDNPDIVYALTGCGDGLGIESSAGVMLTQDGGQTWLQMDNGLSGMNFSGYAIAQHPSIATFIMIATNKGVFRSEDGGSTWSQVVHNIHIYDIAFHPTDSSIVYAAGLQQVLRSDSYGDYATWETITFQDPPANPGRKALAVTPANPDIVYLLTGPHTGAGTFSGFYKSSDAGQSYQLMSTTPNILDAEPGTGNNSQSYYDFCLAASPTDSNLVTVGGLVTWKSENGGVDWTNITTYGAQTEAGYVHPDIHALAFNPLNGHLYNANDGGLHKSTDNGSTWVNLSEGIAATQFYHMDAIPTNTIRIVGGAQDNGVKYRRFESQYFDHVGSADGFCPAIHTSDNSIVYCSINEFLVKFYNDGADNQPIAPKAHWFMQVAVHETLGDIVFAGTNGDGGRLYRSASAGASWDTVAFVPAGHSLATCPSQLSRLYFTGLNKVWRTDDLGNTYDSLHSNPGFPALPQGAIVTDIAVHPLDADIVYLAVSGFVDGFKVYKSVNAGGNWTDFTSNMPNIPMRCLAIHDNGDVYAGTHIGVFYRRSGSSAWQPYRNRLPATMVTDLIIYPSANIIRASTFGRGIWTSALANGVCDVSLIQDANTPLSGYFFHEVSDYIETNAIISGGTGTDIYYKAGNYIDLKPGFEVKEPQTTFVGYIGLCGSGGIPDIETP